MIQRWRRAVCHAVTAATPMEARVPGAAQRQRALTATRRVGDTVTCAHRRRPRPRRRHRRPRRRHALGSSLGSRRASIRVPRTRTSAPNTSTRRVVSTFSAGGPRGKMILSALARGLNATPTLQGRQVATAHQSFRRRRPRRRHCRRCHHLRKALGPATMMGLAPATPQRRRHRPRRRRPRRRPQRRRRPRPCRRHRRPRRRHARGSSLGSRRASIRVPRT